MHHENYGLARSFESGKAVGVQYWTGSVSTWVSINPSFRMFEVDVQTMLPVKVHTYVFNVSDPNPKWQWHHELTEYYNMPDLSPQSFDDLSTRFIDDEALAMQFLNTEDQFGLET